MFDVRSDEYEVHLGNALLEAQRNALLGDVLSIGGVTASTAKDTLSCTEEDGKRAFSSTHSGLLQRCKEIERAFVDAVTSRSDATAPTASMSAAAMLHEQVVRTSRIAVQDIAADDAKDPHTKRATVCDGLRRLLCPDGGLIVWEAVVEYLSLLVALDRMVVGDDSVEQLLDELDLAVVYIAMHRYDQALQHASIAFRLLKVVRDMKIPEPLVKRRLCLVRAIGQLHFNPDIALQAAQAAYREFDALDIGGSPMVYHYAILAANAAIGSTADDFIGAALKDARSFTDVCSIYLIRAATPVAIMARADRGLREPAVRSAKDKLLQQVAAAGSKRELEDVHRELDRVVAAISDKNQSLQLALLRAADQIDEMVRRCFNGVKGHPRTTQGLHDTCLLAFVRHRALAVTLRKSYASETVFRLVDVVEPLWGHQLATVACFDGIAMLLGDEPPRSILPAHLLRSIAASHRDPIHGGHGAILDQITILDNVVNSAKRSDDEDDEDAAVSSPAVAMQSQGVAERITALMFADNAYESDATRLPYLLLLSKLYKVNHQTAAQTRLAALIVACSSRLHGPTSASTKAYAEMFSSVAVLVHAPTISPNWGVQKLLQPVTIICGTPNADIFVSVAASSDHTTHHAFRYDGPIVLDKVGRIVVRAFAVRDGTRSATVEAHFSVQPQ